MINSLTNFMNVKLFFVVLIVILLTLLVGCSQTSSNFQGTQNQLEEAPLIVSDTNCPDKFPFEQNKNPTVIEWAEFEQCGKSIPSKYENPTSCEVNSDCIYQDSGCGGIGINKYNKVEDYVKKVGEATGYYPHCYSQTLPSSLQAPYCTNNKCVLKTDCSNCNEINDYMDRIGCSQERPSETVSGTCNRLAKCNC
jgi:hypothetical protein